MNARILVVEDDLTVAEGVVDYLRHAGLEPRHAVDGAAAGPSGRPREMFLQFVTNNGAAAQP